jgi:magnesium transporter
MALHLGEEHSCQLIVYDEEQFTQEFNSPKYYAAEFSILRKQSIKKIYWLNFDSIKCRTEIEEICASLGGHRTSTEDIFSKKQRPKLEDYQSYLFFSIKSSLPNTNHLEELNTEQISFLLGSNYVISFQERKSANFDSVRDRIINKKGIIRTKETDFLLYRLLECITDNFFDSLEEITLRIDFLEQLVAQRVQRETLIKIEFQKRRLYDLRKIVLPMRDITSQLEDSECNLIHEKNHHFFNDLKDNCLSAIDDLDASKQMLDSLTNLYYAALSQRMNEIMKVLAVVNTIFVPLTFVAGVYGMNFDGMPPYNWQNGYLYVWVGFIGITIGLLIYFKVRKWL